MSHILVAVDSRESTYVLLMSNQEGFVLASGFGGGIVGESRTSSSAPAVSSTNPPSSTSATTSSPPPSSSTATTSSSNEAGGGGDGATALASSLPSLPSGAPTVNPMIPPGGDPHTILATSISFLPTPSSIYDSAVAMDESGGVGDDNQGTTDSSSFVNAPSWKSSSQLSPAQRVEGSIFGGSGRRRSVHGQQTRPRTVSLLAALGSEISSPLVNPIAMLADVVPGGVAPTSPSSGSSSTEIRGPPSSTPGAIASTNTRITSTPGTTLGMTGGDDLKTPPAPGSSSLSTISNSSNNAPSEQQTTSQSTTTSSSSSTIPIPIPIPSTSSSSSSSNITGKTLPLPSPTTTRASTVSTPARVLSHDNVPSDGEGNDPLSAVSSESSRERRASAPVRSINRNPSDIFTAVHGSTPSSSSFGTRPPPFPLDAPSSGASTSNSSPAPSPVMEQRSVDPFFATSFPGMVVLNDNPPPPPSGPAPPSGTVSRKKARKASGIPSTTISAVTSPMFFSPSTESTDTSPASAPVTPGAGLGGSLPTAVMQFNPPRAPPPHSLGTGLDGVKASSTTATGPSTAGPAVPGAGGAGGVSGPHSGSTAFMPSPVGFLPENNRVAPPPPPPSTAPLILAPREGSSSLDLAMRRAAFAIPPELPPDYPVKDRIRYSAGSNEMFVNLEGMEFTTEAKVLELTGAVYKQLHRIGHKVHAIFNYDAVYIADEVMPVYVNAALNMNTEWYLSVRRFTAGSYLPKKMVEYTQATSESVPTFDESSVRVRHYVLEKLLGEGDFGSVYAAMNTKTGERVAIKVMSIAMVEAVGGQDFVELEKTVLQVLDHPHTVRMTDCFVTETHHYLVLEFIPGETLKRYLSRKRGERIPEVEAAAYMAQLVSALNHCHNELELCHRDLKLDNIMLSPPPSTSKASGESGTCPSEMAGPVSAGPANPAFVRLTDFGTASYYRPGTAALELFCGTQQYCPPEMFRGSPYEGPEVDIWSLGVVLFAMVSGYLPFPHSHDTLSGNFEPPTNLSPSLISLLSGMFSVDPTERLTIVDVAAHPWLNSFPSPKILDKPWSGFAEEVGEGES